MCRTGDRAFAEGEEVIARFVDRRLAAVDEERSGGDGGAVELARRGDARADGVDVRAGTIHSRRSTGSREFVAVTMMSAPRTASSTLPSRPPQHRGCRGSVRTSGIALGATFACTPAPRIASTEASSRARSFVATAETAAVRIAVIADGVHHRQRLAGLAAVQDHGAEMRVEVRAADFPEKTQTSFRP